ncbi:hypothetical protein LLQ54_20180 [Rouxiella badensis]|uniref:hypothetical protein n=1 Tax=Rouxiella badensis TaxID=1646377 RepID=UPI001B4FD304|nr:hypothetical protein [Rouxiella badensis]MCC3720515.1 hypothetical protein [Rouxiella badensis]MCC3730354.1 hypothetical protein [Rouxiella badensis]MCC3742195.1 hypothetical protein [Rouxiella badensis]
MAVGDVIYSSNDSIDGSDGAMRIIVTVGGKKIPVTSAAIKMLVGGNTISARDAMGIAGQIQEYSGNPTLGGIDLLADGTGTNPQATLGEVITRVNLLITNYNTFIQQARNIHQILGAPSSSTGS